MAYPYATSLSGLLNTIQQLRTSSPPTITSDTLKKWNIAPANETYIINTLRFLGLIDEEGNRQAELVKVFSAHEDEDFAQKFQPLIKKAYQKLFEDFGEDAWTLDEGRLISFFRVEDDSSAGIGRRQATTFRKLAGLAGYGPKPVEVKVPRKRQPKAAKAKSTVKETTSPAPPASGVPNVGNLPTGLTVRIEVNLPVTEDQEVYDKIFKSIRKNLLNE